MRAGWPVWMLLVACGGKDDAGTDTPGTDADVADADTDTDSDSDTDTDSDSDTETYTDTGTTETGTTDSGTPYTGPPGPPVVFGNCPGYAVASHVEPYYTSPELHILGVYTSGGAGGSINVQVDRTAPMVLVLSAYDPVSWNLTVAAGATLNEVVLNGYSAQTVSGVPAGVPVTLRSPYTAPWLGSYGYDWPGPGTTSVLVNGAQATTGLTLTSFHGCYRASGFLVQ